MTVLERLEIIAIQIKSIFDETQLTQFLAAKGLNATDEWTEDAESKIWLTYADMLEVFASNIQNYSQGEISETIDREALLELARNIRMRYLSASRSEIYYNEEAGNGEW